MEKRVQVFMEPVLQKVGKDEKLRFS